MRMIVAFLKKILNVLLNIFFVLFCFMIDLTIGMFYLKFPDLAGTLQLPAIIAILLWVVLIVVFIKISPYFSVLTAAAVYLVIYLARFGINDYWICACIITGLWILGGFWVRKRAGGFMLRKGSAPRKSGPRKKADSFHVFASQYDSADEEDEDDLYERRQQKGHRPNDWCCEYLKEFNLGYYKNGMSQLCAVLGSQMTVDDARRRCYYSENYERCPVWQKQKGGSWQGRYAGKGTSPTSYCCKFLKEYPSSYYDSYSHRCEATEMELPYDEARQRCYYSDGYQSCPIWQRNH